MEEAAEGKEGKVGGSDEGERGGGSEEEKEGGPEEERGGEREGRPEGEGERERGGSEGERGSEGADKTARPETDGGEGPVVDVMSFTKPNQPDPKFIKRQVMKDRTLSFQKVWYEKHPWLHVSPGIEGVLCFHCAKYYTSGIPAQDKNTDPAFVSSGYKNWRRGLEKFSVHEKSAAHKMAVTTAAYEKKPCKRTAE